MNWNTVDAQFNGPHSAAGQNAWIRQNVHWLQGKSDRWHGGRLLPALRQQHLKIISMLLFQFVDAEGIVNEDLPNSWECPECVKEGYNKEYKVSAVFVAPALFAINSYCSSM